MSLSRRLQTAVAADVRRRHFSSAVSAGKFASSAYATSHSVSREASWSAALRSFYCALSLTPNFSWVNFVSAHTVQATEILRSYFFHPIIRSARTNKPPAFRRIQVP